MSFTKEEKLGIAKGLAWVAAVFAIIVSVIMIFNYIQLLRVDPLETPALQTLVDQLKNDPSNEAIKEDIRALDLMIRKAYFTSQWQLRTGGIMLVLSVVVIVVALRFIRTSANNPEELEKIEKNPSLDKEKARKWVVYAGAGFFVLALLSGLLSSNALKKYGQPGNVVAADSANSNVVVATFASDANTTGEVIADSSSLVNTAPGVDASQATEVGATTVATVGSSTVSNTAVATPTTADLRRNFPYFRGPEGSGVAYKNSVPTSFNVGSGQKVVWKAAIPLRGFNSPIVWGNKVFLTGANETDRAVYCYDASTGKLLWEAKATGIQGSPTTAIQVTEDTGLAAPTAATNGNAVFAIFANGDVIALDMEGKRLWAKNIGRPDNYYGHSSSLILYKNNLIIQYDTNRGSKVMALSVTDGTTRWETVRNVKIAWSSPIIVNTGSRDELLLTADPYLISYNPETGKEYWYIECLSGEVGPSAGYDNGIVYTANEYASLSAIKIGTTPEILWQQTEYLPEASSPLAHNGLVIVATSYGVVACYDGQTGDKYWEMETDDSIYGSPVFAGDNVYLMTNQGKLYVFKLAKQYQQVAVSDLGENSICTPTFIEGKMFLRGYDNLFCIGI